MNVSRQNQIRDTAARALFKSGASRALLRKREPRPVVLLYHNPDPTVFAAHLAFLAEYFAFVPIPGAGGAAEARPSVSFTFDDGYRGVHTNISPLLKAAGAPATMFIPTAFLGKRFSYEALKLALQHSPLQSFTFEGSRLPLADSAERKDAWHALVAKLKLLPSHERDARVDAIIEKLKVAREAISGADIVTREELRAMAEQLEIGSHTVTHPNLSCLGRSEAERELSESKVELEAITNKPCRVFAYPIGRSDDYTLETVEVLAKTGYAKAFTAVPTTSADSDFEYPRVGIGDRDSVELLCLKLTSVWPKLFRILV